MRKIPGLFSKLRVFIILFFTSASVSAQVNVTGSVTDTRTGAGVPGVTVSIKGSKTAVQTTNDGSFSIKAPANATLVFTSIGYDRKEMAVSAAPLNVGMAPNTSSLS